MAAIDKLYGTKEQYFDFRNWCLNNNPEALDFFYPSWDHKDNLTHAMTSFPIHIDKWMLQNCPFDYIKKQIKDQYNIDGVYDLMAFLNEEDD
jgi:hypothetical protein